MFYLFQASKTNFIHKVVANSKFPSSICLECLTKLNHFNEFFTSSTENQCVLQIIFGKDDEEEESSVEPTTVKQIEPVSTSSICYEPQSETSKEQFFIIEEFNTDADATQFSDEVQTTDTKFKVDTTQTPRKKFNRFDCFLCNEQFPVNLKFTQHFAEQHPGSEIRYQCFVCRAFVGTYRSFTRHIESHSQPKRFSCDKCNSSFSQKITLVQHLKSHSQIKSYQCKDCNLNFKQNASLFKHRRQKHSNDIVQCLECGKTLVNKETLEQHLRSKHRAESNITCEKCDKKFASRSALKYHNVSHHQLGDEKDRQCSKCSKVLKTPVIFKRHLKRCK